MLCPFKIYARCVDRRASSEDWEAVAATLLTGVTCARDRGEALAYCRTAAAEIVSGADVLSLGRELSALGRRSSRTDREIANLLAQCFYQSVYPFNAVMTPYLIRVTSVVPAAGAGVAIAIGEVPLAALLGLAVVALLSQARKGLNGMRTAFSTETATPPADEAFLALRCIRKLPPPKG